MHDFRDWRHCEDCGRWYYAIGDYLSHGTLEVCDDCRRALELELMAERKPWSAAWDWDTTEVLMSDEPDDSRIE